MLLYFIALWEDNDASNLLLCVIIVTTLSNRQI